MIICKEDLILIEKNAIEEKASSLTGEETERLVEWLSQKDDKIRYHAFLILQARSRIKNDIYPYWDIFRDKLKSDNSYQRSLGVILLAENVRWDMEHKMKEILADYLEILKDEKKITVRQCIQSLEIIAREKPPYMDIIADSLMSLDIMSVQETMRKSILLDVVNALLEIRKTMEKKEIDAYIIHAASGGILDKKSQKTILDKVGM